MIPGSTPTMGNGLTGRPAAIALAPFACARNLICVNLSNHLPCPFVKPPAPSPRNFPQFPRQTFLFRNFMLC